jgi:hypothetical protein
MPNNNDAIMQALAKMQQDILGTRQMLQDLIHILAPVFPSERVAQSSSEQMEQALVQGIFIFDAFG